MTLSQDLSRLRAFFAISPEKEQTHLELQSPADTASSAVSGGQAAVLVAGNVGLSAAGALALASQGITGQALSAADSVATGALASADASAAAALPSSVLLPAVASLSPVAVDAGSADAADDEAGDELENLAALADPVDLFATVLKKVLAFTAELGHDAVEGFDDAVTYAKSLASKAK